MKFLFIGETEWISNSNMVSAKQASDLYLSHRFCRNTLEDVLALIQASAICGLTQLLNIDVDPTTRLALVELGYYIQDNGRISW